MLNTLMQSLPSMSAGYHRPLSPDFIVEIVEPELQENCVMDAHPQLRLKTFGQTIRLALRSRKWGHGFGYTECIQLNWWLQLSEVGFPKYCDFDCVDWDNGCGFGCDHRSWRSELESVMRYGYPHYIIKTDSDEHVYDDLQSLAYVEMAPPIVTVQYVAPAHPAIMLNLTDTVGCIDASEFTDEMWDDAYDRHYELFESNSDEDFVPDELTPHKFAHIQYDLESGRYAPSNLLRREIRREKKRNAKRNRSEREFSTPVRSYQRKLRKWESKLAGGYVFTDWSINRYGWVIFPLEEKQPVPLDVIAPADRQDNDENFVGDQYFEDINDTAEGNIHGGAIVDERVCCGYTHGSNYHKVLGMPTGRILHDRAEEFEHEIHPEWASVLPSWSRWMGDAEHMYELFYGYSMWLSRLQYLVITGTLPLNRYRDYDIDPHLFGDCNCQFRYSCEYCEYDNLDAPTLDDELDQSKSEEDTKDYSDQDTATDHIDKFLFAKKEVFRQQSKKVLRLIAA